ncbi:WbqC family protein [Thalassotalea sp. SU-HH00458]|uniref:WbqC family protein n=1 Tax=Thalassotalea sp. SU-HH00458 TaxID=3127657 RepID=UPI0031064803
MKVAIMQPYFVPYIGYFQLINAVDKFVIYDDIEYTKKGWINRNRILRNGEPVFISLPLKKDSDYLNVCQRTLSHNWDKDKRKLLNQIKGNYSKAKSFDIVYPLIENIINFENDNLFEFLHHSLKVICNYLNINTEFVISSSLKIDPKLKSQDKVIEICNKLHASQYINPVGGLALYTQEEFSLHHIKLSFLQSTEFTYEQFSNEYCPWLSILDVMMFNEIKDVKTLINSQFKFI